MSKIDQLDDTIFKSNAIRVLTPDGSLYVVIVEDKSGAPIMINGSIGKGGTSVFAWSHALMRICNLALDKGVTLGELAHELTSITSAKSSPNGRVNVRSGPEGIAYAILQYLSDKKGKLLEKYGF